MLSPVGLGGGWSGSLLRWVEEKGENCYGATKEKSFSFVAPGCVAKKKTVEKPRAKNRGGISSRKPFLPSLYTTIVVHEERLDPDFLTSNFRTIIPSVRRRSCHRKLNQRHSGFATHRSWYRSIQDPEHCIGLNCYTVCW